MLAISKARAWCWSPSLQNPITVSPRMVPSWWQQRLLYAAHGLKSPIKLYILFYLYLFIALRYNGHTTYSLRVYDIIIWYSYTLRMITLSSYHPSPKLTIIFFSWWELFRIFFWIVMYFNFYCKNRIILSNPRYYCLRQNKGFVLFCF